MNRMTWKQNRDGSFTAKDGKDTFRVTWTADGGKIQRNGETVASGWSSRDEAMNGAESYRRK